MIVRELLTRIGYDVDPKAEQKAKSGFKRVKDAAGKLGIALSVGAVALGFKKTLDLASDVEETMNVVSTAFEDQTSAVLAWAKESGEAAGRSEFAMREYAATVGAVVGPTLGSAEATAELSTDMAQLAVDLGSFFNATDDDALQALRSGLVGQSEPLLRFGVAMNVAALDAFALEQGLGKTTKKMSQAEKITLRYRFILANTAKAQGDAERTSAGYANQQKRLGGNLKDLAIVIGKFFLPTMATVLQVINAVVVELKGPFVIALRLLTAPIKLVATTIAGLVVGLTQMGTVSKIVFSAMLGLILAIKAPFIITFAIIGGLILAALLLVEDLWLGLTEGKGVMAGVAKEFMRFFDETGSALAALGGILATALDYWIERFFGVSNATDKVADAMRSAGTAVSDFFVAVIDEAAVKVTALRDTIIDLPRAIWQAIKNILPGLAELSKRLDPGGVLSGFISSIGLGDIFGGAGPKSIAAPGSPAAGGGGVSSQQSIEVNVNAPGADGPAVAAAVAPAVGRAAADGNRRTAQQLLLGGATP